MTKTKAKRPRGSVSFDLGSRTAFAVRAVPRTEFTLGPPVTTVLDRRVTDLTLRGTCKHLPDDTPCTVTWLVKEGNVEREVVDPEPRRLRLMKGGAEFLLDVRLDALAMGLFGEGTLACVVQPKFPHCPKGSFAHGPLKYDNTPYVFGEGPSRPPPLDGLDLTIGARVLVSVELRGCFRGFSARLNVFESDIHEAMTPSSLGLSRTFEWLKGDVTPVAWRIGCTEPAEGAPVVFDYQDPGEEGPELELDYELWLADPADMSLVWVSRPGEEGWFWKRVPEPPPLRQGQAKGRAPAVEEKHGKVKAKLRFRELAPIGELEPDAVRSWQFTPKVPQPGLKKKDFAKWPRFTAFPRKEDFGPLDKWVYAFAHDKETNEIKLVDERFCELKKDRDVNTTPDVSRVHPRPVKEANRRPDTRSKLARPLESQDEQYFTYEYDSSKVDLYFCLSRIQLPHWRLRDYETDGRTIDPKAPKETDARAQEANARAQLHTDRAVRRLRDRCLRYAPWDESFQLRYLDQKGGVDVVEEPELPDVQVLYLPDVLQIVEDAQQQYLDDAQKVLNLAGSEGWDETDSYDAQYRFLAALVGPVVDKYTESEEGQSRIRRFFNVPEFRRWVETYDKELQTAQKRVELWQQYKLTWIDDAQAAADDERFLGKGLYAETRDDHLVSRRLGDKEARGRADPKNAEEVKLYAANEDAFFAHWAKTVEHTTASAVGKVWTVRQLYQPGSFTRDILLDPAVVFGSARERIGAIPDVVAVLEQHVLVPAAKFGTYEPLTDEPSLREAVTSTGDEVVGGIKNAGTARKIIDTLRLTEEAVAKNFKGLASFDLTRATVERYQDGSTIVFTMKLETKGKSPIYHRFPAHLDFKVNETDARRMLRALGADEPKITIVDNKGLRPPVSLTDDAKHAVAESSMTKDLGRVMLFLNGVNFLFQLPKLVDALGGDGSTGAKVKAALSFGEAAADFVASVEVVSVVAELPMTARLSVVVRYAGIAAGVLGVALATWNAYEAFSDGKYGEGIAQVAIGVGTAAVLISGVGVGAGLITAGAATWWAGIGIVLMIVGGILAFVFGQPDITAIEKWLERSPWGYSEAKDQYGRKLHPATHARTLLEILIKPKVMVWIDPPEGGKPTRVRVDIYSLYFVHGRTQYLVETLDATQGDKTITFIPYAWLPEVPRGGEPARLAPNEVAIVQKPWPDGKLSVDRKNLVSAVSAEWHTGLLDATTKTRFEVKLRVKYHPEWAHSKELYEYKDEDS